VGYSQVFVVKSRVDLPQLSGGRLRLFGRTHGIRSFRFLMTFTQPAVVGVGAARTGWVVSGVVLSRFTVPVFSIAAAIAYLGVRIPFMFCNPFLDGFAALFQ
jgi:hypothetical protein